jgi:hypothetical protein
MFLKVILKFKLYPNCHDNASNVMSLRIIFAVSGR